MQGALYHFSREHIQSFPSNCCFKAFSSQIMHESQKYDSVRISSDWETWTLGIQSGIVSRCWIAEVNGCTKQELFSSQWKLSCLRTKLNEFGDHNNNQGHDWWMVMTNKWWMTTNPAQPASGLMKVFINATPTGYLWIAVNRLLYEITAIWHTYVMLYIRVYTVHVLVTSIYIIHDRCRHSSIQF